MKTNSASNEHPEVSVLMSSYNGEQYISEQINSILNQTYPNIKLIIRDDGSTDSTLKILNDYSDSAIVLAESNVGCKASFLKVAQYAFKEQNESQYFAFSDQDDYWLTDKIERAVKTLEEYKNFDIPLLYICQTNLVDKNLKPINAVKKRKYYYTLGEALMLGTCAGCTMVFNRKLLELFSRAKSDYMFLHDDWIYKVCLACNGKLLVDNKSYILYRQHGTNTIGGNQSRYKAWKRRLKMFSEGGIRSSIAKPLLDLYADDLSEGAKKILADVANYRYSLRCRLHLLFSNRFKTGNSLFNYIFRIAIIFNRF